ncbi:hypothetical protein A2V56_01620 [Candidatus Woesebacteria bacterium RBG_19FT_COMBO_42_9]|uniref:RND efflux pump membrane fusion protein barrel-sandwich domain-containing protein n=1 Tax=Candidatus Woesebacteria bacterium RBG_16_42_24 TaxID=1802485 RepID=A0A1F7XMK3_9BACT|nr:MAG: hypothetical protein A2V97_02385 [Candidatus Woesebacteria bacterium RBG_16_42_24]OGM16290.1 MAG: hypothetical protein A2V56_01620 [Candidatus Woesebacteria bacterium RBG_19FT_COMBO_42_9]OGM68616.1 MAG: hypothetical protein A2985_01175 [Candidatus Woesebacteria bacterium RIFCSPLOWO2_01_FULL_43_11]
MRKIINFFWRRKILLAALLIVIAYGIWSFIISPKKDVRLSYQVQKGTVAEELVLTGQVKAAEHAFLSFQSSGELAWLGVAEGEVVKKGQRLANLDTKIPYETFESAVAELRGTQASLDNVYDQVQGHATDESFAQRDLRTSAEVRRDKSYRALEIAKKNLSNLYLTAPFPGIVSSVTYPFTGIFIPLSQGVIEVVNPDSLYFEVSADQTEVAQLKNGVKVKIILDAYPSEEVDGVVSYVGYTPISGEVGTVYKVKIAFTEAYDLTKFRVGMGGDAKLILTEKENVLFAPPEFISSDATGKYIFVGPQKKKVYIETGIEGEDRVEIVSGISAGDTIYD